MINVENECIKYFYTMNVENLHAYSGDKLGNTKILCSDESCLMNEKLFSDESLNE